MNTVLYKLNKSVLSIKSNPAEFLNGLTSNTLDRPQNAFLNIHGRIIATFEQVKISDDEMWIVLATPYVEDLMNHLDRYIKLAGVKISQLQKYVYFSLGAESTTTPGVVVDLQKAGCFLITDTESKASVPEAEFTLFRLKNNIPLQGIDFTNEFILNVSETEYVSFTKGCFLGQEPVSKVHNRSKPTWRLTACYEDECEAQARAKMTSKVLDPKGNRVLGFTFIRCVEGHVKEEL